MFRPLLLGLCVAVLASGCTAMAPQNNLIAEAPRTVQAGCLQQTGSRILRREGDCISLPGRSYSREDLQRTGALSTAAALSALDPSLR